MDRVWDGDPAEERGHVGDELLLGGDPFHLWDREGVGWRGEDRSRLSQGAAGRGGGRRQAVDGLQIAADVAGSGDQHLRRPRNRHVDAIEARVRAAELSLLLLLLLL